MNLDVNDKAGRVTVAQQPVKTGILTLDVEGWCFSVRTYDGGFEVAISDDSDVRRATYVRLDAEQSETLRDFLAEMIPSEHTEGERAFPAEQVIEIIRYAMRNVRPSDVYGAVYAKEMNEEITKETVQKIRKVFTQASQHPSTDRGSAA